MPTALFIGGYADGKMIDVPDGEERYVVNEYDDSLSAYGFVGSAAPETVHVRQHVYCVDSLRAGDDRWRVFVPLNTTPRDWIDALIRNYRPAQRTGADP